MRNILIVVFLSSFLLACTTDDRDRTRSQQTKEAIAIDNKRQDTIGEDESEEIGYKTDRLVGDSSHSIVDTNPSKSELFADKDISLESDEQNERSEEGFFIRNFWALLSMLFLVVIYVMLNNRIRNNHDKIRNITDKLNKLKINQSSGFQNRSNQNEGLEKLRKLNERIDELESIVHAEKNANKETSVEGNNGEEDNVTQGPVVVDLPINKKEEIQSTVFYMATPNGEREFHTRSRSETFKPTQILYRFFADKSGENAEFEFYSDESGIQESANSPHIYIEPVCEPQNAQNPNAKKIRTIDKGKAEKRGDKWVVTEKAKIKYE